MYRGLGGVMREHAEGRERLWEGFWGGPWGGLWGRFWGAPWVQFADRLGEQKCCVFSVYRGLGGVMREDAKGRNRRPPWP